MLEFVKKEDGHLVMISPVRDQEIKIPVKRIKSAFKATDNFEEEVTIVRLDSGKSVVLDMPLKQVEDLVF